MSGMRIGPGDEGELVSVLELAEWLLRDRSLYPVQMLRSLADQQQPEVFMQASAAVPPQGIGADWRYTARAEGRRMLSRGLAGGGDVSRPVGPSYSGPAGFLTLLAYEWERNGAAPSGVEQVGFRKAWLRQVGFWPEVKPVQVVEVAPEATQGWLDPGKTREQVAAAKEKAMASIQSPERNDRGQVSWTSTETCHRFLKAIQSLQGAGMKQDEALDEIAKAWSTEENSLKGSSLKKRVTECKKDKKGHQGARNTA